MRRKRKSKPETSQLSRCPCCYYLTLEERGAYDMCPLCLWEDDGQDDKTADECWGGPNGELSLTQGRYNFARIGASGWTDLRHKAQSERKVPGSLPKRATGFPFASIEMLQGPPPLTSWPDPWTISFHTAARDPASRWRESVRFLLSVGYKFQGTIEWKKREGPEWAHPRFLRLLEHDPAFPIEDALAGSGRIVVGGWFLYPSGGGARLRFQSVWRFREDWNEPPITIEAYVHEDDAARLFEALPRNLPVVMANASRTSWGLSTIAEMAFEFFHSDPFLLGRTYLQSSIADQALLDGFRALAGPRSVEPLASGFVLTGRWGTVSKEGERPREFVTERLRAVAMRMTKS